MIFSSPDSPNEREIPFFVGEEMELELVGKAIGREHRREPFGWHKKVRMIVNDAYCDNESLSAFPGEKVIARVNYIDHNHTHVTVMKNEGPFIDKFVGQTKRIAITGKSPVDARNAVSDPSDPSYRGKAGICGVKVVIDNCNGFEPYLNADEWEFSSADVEITNYTKGKHGYVMFAKPESYEIEVIRIPKSYIFFSSFRNSEIDFNRLHEMIGGVPKRDPPGIVFHVNKEGYSSIIFRKSREDLTGYELDNAIQYFMEKLRDDTFPLALIEYNSIIGNEGHFKNAAINTGINPEELYRR